MKMTSFWDTAPCSIIDVDQRFRGVYCIHHQSNEACTFATSIYFNEIALRCILESCHLHTHCCETLKFHIL
jgi:hypothetical protein